MILAGQNGLIVGHSERRRATHMLKEALGGAATFTIGGKIGALRATTVFLLLSKILVYEYRRFSNRGAV